MYFHTLRHIYLTYFNNEIVALDLKNDKYILFSENYSETIFFALNNEFRHVDNRHFPINGDKTLMPYDFDETIEYLRELGIFSKKDYGSPHPRILKKSIFSAGAPNIDWRMPSIDTETKIKAIKVLEAYFILIKTYFIIKLFGFHQLIKTIKRNKKQSHACVDSKEFNSLVIALNKACFYFPIRTKCLEWSAALAQMGLRRKWQCNLEIGVQNSPFAAHAWVTVGDTVIADVETLPKTLSIILSEPFSKG